MHFRLSLNFNIFKSDLPRYCLVFAVAAMLVIAGSAVAQKDRPKKKREKARAAETSDGARKEPKKEKEEEKPATAPVGPPGTVEIDIGNVTGASLKSRVELLALDERPMVVIDAASGTATAQAAAGSYRAYIYVLEEDVPVLVDVQDIEVKAGGTAYVVVTLLEGAAGRLTVRDFDFDGDLAIDSVELKAGTDREDAASVPGKAVLPRDNKIIQNEMRWYRGELISHSVHGGGTESVSELIKRAEKAGLDFLAITDRNTLQSIYDEGYHSDSVVLIPAMEWGDDERGYAYIYGPKTPPSTPTTRGAAQAECIRVQAQGGVFAVAHPAFAAQPWLWGLSYVNAINVWQGAWKAPAPLRLTQLSEDMKLREEGRLVHSIAAASARADLETSSGNELSTLFWDYEMTRGLMACAIAGSGSKGAKEPLGKPITYIKAKTKSLPGLLEGLRFGYTYVSKGVDGPQLFFQGDVLNDKKVDVSIGGIVPTGMETVFIVGVKGADGKKLQVIQDGRTILSRSIEGDSFVTQFPLTPNSASAFRVRVTEASEASKEMGLAEVVAMSSPIYSRNIASELLQRPDIDVDKLWVKVDAEAESAIGRTPTVQGVSPTPKMMDQSEQQR
jgi:hypothetical protein